MKADRISLLMVGVFAIVSLCIMQIMTMSIFPEMSRKND